MEQRIQEKQHREGDISAGLKKPSVSVPPAREGPAGRRTEHVKSNLSKMKIHGVFIVESEDFLQSESREHRTRSRRSPAGGQIRSEPAEPPLQRV